MLAIYSNPNDKNLYTLSRRSHKAEKECINEGQSTYGIDK
jgi:hypothetical protein